VLSVRLIRSPPFEVASAGDTTVRTTPLLRASLRSLAFVAALGLATSAGATLIGGSTGNPNLGPDDGSEVYVPNLNPVFNRHIVLVKELFDPVLAAFPHSWGFYFAGDTSNLYPIFTASDQGPPQQQSVIDFDNGKVVDLDSLAVESSFTPSLGDFGFYLRVQFPAGTLTTFSQASENGGVDTFASFPYLPNPLFRLVAFEVNEQLFSLEIIDGAVPVPEPSVLLMVGGGLVLMLSGRRLFDRV
jgi:hypothetical protein